MNHSWLDQLTATAYFINGDPLDTVPAVNRKPKPEDIYGLPVQPDGPAIAVLARELLRLAQREADLLDHANETLSTIGVTQPHREQAVHVLASNARRLDQRVRDLEDAHREAIGLETMAYHTGQAAMTIARRRIAALERSESDALTLATKRGERIAELENERADLISERDGWKRTLEHRDAKIAGLERQLSRETVEGALAREDARELQRLLTERGHKLALKNAQIAQLREDAAVFSRTVKQLEIAEKAVAASESRGRQYCLELAEKAGRIRELEEEDENLARCLQDQRAANRSLSADAALARELVALLIRHCGESGEDEGALETLRRIIRERDNFLVLYRRSAGEQAESDAWKASRIRELEEQLAGAVMENQGLKMAAEEAGEIEAELVTALALGHGEDLASCIPLCPGHLGPKASAAVDRAATAWRELTAENEGLRAEVERLARDGQDAEEESRERIKRMEAAIADGLASV